MRLLFLLLLLPSVVLAERPKPEPHDDAIRKGLEYLRDSQNRDGSWSAGRSGGSDPAITALGVMAFLSAGHVPGEGPFADTVEKGIRFVLAIQHNNGSFAPLHRGPIEMYYQGICTLMLAEVVGLLPDRNEAKKLRDRLQKAIQLILKAQRKFGEDKGGWRYSVSGDDSDLSVTGWQLMALRAAKNVGCDIPPETIEKAVDYTRKCYDPLTGGFRYTLRDQVTIPCTGTGILALELCGKEYHRSRESLKAGGYLLKRENRLDPARNHFFYGIYYTSQAMFQLGDNYWKSYRLVLHELLLSVNPPRSAGLWIGKNQSSDDSMFGPNYCTAMAILALTVEYRYLPIYQRDEE